jgi:glycosyltransferase involved in cell wall biosynthesis
VLETVFAIPGDLATATGGYAYARRVIELLPEHGIAVRHLALPASYPNVTDADLDETDRLLCAASKGAVLLIDGLAYGAIPARRIDGLGRTIVALVHHPLFLETGLSARRRAELLALEKAALARAARVIATSTATARLLKGHFDVPARSVAVAEPGTEPRPRARGTAAPTQLLAIGAVSPRKGYDLLAAALSELAHLDWRLTIVGALDRSPDCVARLRDAIAASGLDERIALAGQVSEVHLAELYDRADVLVSPSLFEGYGMVLTEAMAHGLALVASTGGAAAETVPEGAGIKVPPGDVDALRDALRRVIADPGARQALADRAWAAGQKLPRWSETAARVAAVLKDAAA